MSKTEMRELVDGIITGLDALGDARGYQKCKLITDTLENAVALRGAIDEIPAPRQETDCRRQEPEDAMMPEAGGQTGEEGGADVCG